MKNILRFLSIAALTGIALLPVSSCSDEVVYVKTEYDDSEIKDRLDKVEDRVAALEEWCSFVNGEIVSLKRLITALENNDYVTGVETLEDGYKITFSKSGSITIRNGKDGIDGEDGTNGYAPIIGIAKYSDDLYYWTIQTEDEKTIWLTDADGNMIRTTGDNGKNGNDGLTPHIGDNGNWWVGTTDTGMKAQGNNGADGEDGKDGLTPYIGDNGNWWIGTTDTGVKAQGEKGEQGESGTDATAPQVRINSTTNEWEISTDGGKTYTSTGIKATGPEGSTGAKGDSMFSAINTDNEDYVELTLADGITQIKIPRYKTVLRFESYETASVGITDYALKVLLPNNLTQTNYDCIIATIMPVNGMTTRSANNGWTIVGISSPIFDNDGNLSTNDVIVTIKGNGLLAVSDKGLLNILLTYKDGGQLSASRLVEYEGVRFKISEDNYVRFLNGNLQYKVDANGTGKYQIAANQWEYLQKSNGQIYNVTFDTDPYTGQGHYESSDGSDEWITDLFSWGTADNPTFYAQNDADYLSSVPSGEFGSENDWGAKYAEQNGITTNIPRTLTYSEWNNLFKNQIQACVRLVKDDGTTLLANGIVVFPYGMTEDIIKENNWLGGTSPLYKAPGQRDARLNWETTLMTQTNLAASGALFLPTAGYSGYMTAYSSGVIGKYWTANGASNGKAWYFYISDKICSLNIFGSDGRAARGYRYSVRLAVDVE